MSALQRLKAYFGMVPVDEVDAYADERDRYRGDYRGEYVAEPEDYDPYADRVGGHRRGFGRGGYRPEPVDAADYEAERGAGRRGWAGATGPLPDAPVRGALAMDPAREPVPPARPVEQTGPFSRITTLHPRDHSEARTIGEHYREGIPVIMNLTDMDAADAKRLVDFAAGLVFAMRGSMDKITNRVFLLSPPNVDVTAEDRRRLAEGAFLNRS
ncbi:cell division protein SepF [Streptoalloteichus hindustanus]|uniref:Cell division protein SepF n=1 Tax=Streptoalloteichus hindustanus TaxID=2017 RepID=A0A1M5ATF6_STRHI|nr:cell division protein SepF [Streptoalloteichus hindustanus]SHF33485.1 cell division inhibitor SepF [Streptoalloteichus hindustanus]